MVFQCAIRPLLAVAGAMGLLVFTADDLDAQTTSAGAGPVIVMETSKGTIEFETYPEEAPRTVEHIVNLVNRRFYNGLRFHRVVEGFVIQVGDPLSRDMSKRDLWGRHAGANSGRPIGVAEISPTRTHVQGAVAMAHAGDPAQADSQFYITLSPQPGLDGKYTVFGRIIAGQDVPAQIEEGDMIRKMYVKEGTGP